MTTEAAAPAAENIILPQTEVEFRIGLFSMDGHDLYWSEQDPKTGKEVKRSGLELSFDDFADALYARAVWRGFIDNNLKKEPVVKKVEGKDDTYTVIT